MNSHAFFGNVEQLTLPQIEYLAEQIERITDFLRGAALAGVSVSLLLVSTPLLLAPVLAVLTTRAAYYSYDYLKSAYDGPINRRLFAAIENMERFVLPEEKEDAEAAPAAGAPVDAYVGTGTQIMHELAENSVYIGGLKGAEYVADSAVLGPVASPILKTSVVVLSSHAVEALIVLHEVHGRAEEQHSSLSPAMPANSEIELTPIADSRINHMSRNRR